MTSDRVQCRYSFKFLWECIFIKLKIVSDYTSDTKSCLCMTYLVTTKNSKCHTSSAIWDNTGYLLLNIKKLNVQQIFIYKAYNYNIDDVHLVVQSFVSILITSIPLNLK